MNNERLTELAVAFSSGELSGAERREFLTALASGTPGAKQQVSEIIDAAAAVSLLIPQEKPSASLKEKILSRTRRKAPPLPLSFVTDAAAATGWQPMKVPGAFVKLLSLNQERGYAVALGKLEPNTSYPAHTHRGAEDIWILSGDLWIGNTRLAAGDFHHADAGSRHDINHSDTGCTILIVLTTEDLVAQMS